MLYVGIDIGGTFTDCAIIDDRGEIVTIAKAPSYPQDPSQAVISVLEEAARNLGLGMGDFIAQTQVVMHGCTVATNAMIERKGAKTGLLTTRGHEDAIFIGRVTQKVAGLSEREIVHQSRLNKAEPPVIDPSCIRGIPERIDSLGQVVAPLDMKATEKAARELVGSGVESIAVSLLWSFLNTSHEIRIKEMLAAKYPDIFVTISSEVAPLMGEYERTVTAALSAYLRPSVVSYLEKLETRLRDLGFSRQLLISHSMGGLTTVEEVRHRPLLTMDSGPAGGVLGAQFFGKLYGEPNIIGTDMGGTTFDVSLIRGGEASLDEEPVIDKYTFLTPKIAIQSIGAGGGSILWADDDGLLQVGPQSAGATPGPACYGAGGTEATVTDADLFLGYLNPDYFLGGRTKLQKGLAEEALGRLAGKLGMEPVQAASGAFRLVNSRMADLSRRVTIEQGYDARDFALFSFGGAGPVHCAFYGKELGVKAIYIPSFATVFSALGMLTGGIVHSYELSCPLKMPLSSQDIGAIEDIYRRLETRLEGQFVQDGRQGEEITVNRFIYMKYGLQPRALAIPLSNGGGGSLDESALTDMFEARYASIYGEGSGFKQAGIEILKCRVDGSYASTTPTLARESDRAEPDPAAALKLHRDAYFEDAGGFVTVPVYEGEGLRWGNVLQGPCIVERMGDTIVIPPHTRAELDEFKNVRIGGPE
ncbi:MAG: hydantoinase/oxoprolinase family protein [Dehalococcoidia bacterium]